MTLFHETWRRRVSLLALGALTGEEQRWVAAHLAACARCLEEHRSLCVALEVLAADPARRAEPPIPVGALRTRVEARLDAAPVVAPRVAWLGPGLLRPLAAALAVALALIARPTPQRRPPASGVAARAEVPEALLRRLETNGARQRAARYLNEAQDVLITVAARPRDCDRSQDRVDTADEARRSRELLARRALLVDLDRDEVAAARPLLEEVEGVLREVASLDACTRAGDLTAINRQLAERRTLMKIGLLTRELAG
jgi:hypothetical protein